MIILISIIMQQYEKWERNQIKEDYQLIAENNNGYAIYEHYTENGSLLWEIFIDDKCRDTLNFEETEKAEFISFLGAEVLFWEKNENHPFDIYVNRYKFSKTSDTGEIYRMRDVWSRGEDTFPVVEAVETDGTNLWIEVRDWDFRKEDTLSEETVVYYAEDYVTKKDSFLESVETIGELDYFGKKLLCISVRNGCGRNGAALF